MNLKKAIISAIIIFAVIFLVASFLMFVVAIPEAYYGVTMLVLSSVIVYLVVRYYYFTDVEVEKPLKDGIILGIVIAAIVFVIEAVVMVYGFAADQGWSYFTQWSIMVGYLLTILIPVLAAYTKK